MIQKKEKINEVGKSLLLLTIHLVEKKRG